MIDIELKSALTLYSVLLGATFLAIWLYTEISVRRPQRFLGKQFLWHCAFCGYTYLDEQAHAVSRCPRCASYNDASDREARFVPPPKEARAPGDHPPAQPQVRKNPSHRKRPHQKRRGPRKRA